MLVLLAAFLGLSERLALGPLERLGRLLRRLLHVLRILRRLLGALVVAPRRGAAALALVLELRIGGFVFGSDFWDMKILRWVVRSSIPCAGPSRGRAECPDDEPSKTMPPLARRVGTHLGKSRQPSIVGTGHEPRRKEIVMRVRDTWLLEDHYFDEPSDWTISPELEDLVSRSIGREIRLFDPFARIPRPAGTGGSSR